MNRASERRRDTFTDLSEKPFFPSEPTLALLDNSYSILSGLTDSGLFMRLREDSFFNSRTKCYVENGRIVPYEIMVCNRQVFSDSGNEVSEVSLSREWASAYRQANEELFGHGYSPKTGYKAPPSSKSALLDSSRRRARRKIFDYCICNDFDLFITLTLDKDKIDRSDYSAVIKKLNNFLGNRVRRFGLKYIGVPELHKNGGLHFHFAATSSGFKLVDSGTVSVPGRKRPIKVSTADRLGVPPTERHTVYNISDWELGFSTAIKTYGCRGALATYLTKEFCKDVQKRLACSGAIDKIGGRWYLHGGSLNKPICKYQNMNYDELSGFSYEVNTDGGDFKVFKLDENGEVLN